MIETDAGHQEPAESGHRAKRDYFVNGERFGTGETELTVRRILEDAGFTPVEEYRLTRDAGHHVFDHYDTEVSIHEGERFTAIFLGPTPTS
ncbi:MAG TPA: hypothetical protein VFX16_12855 [Pseudonocardiaceae bacterium]|nr:hypothetical protein [Pseudonocardiaceae bacterium]